MAASSFPKPAIAHDLCAVVAVIDSVYSSAGVVLRCEKDEFVESICAELNTRTLGEIREVVLRATLAFVRSKTQQLEADTLTVLTKLAALPEGSIKSKEALRASYNAAKVLTTESEREYLNDAVSFLSDIFDVKDWLSTGSLATALAESFDSVEDDLQLGAVERSVNQLSLSGVDAEKVLWSIIVFESCKHIPLVWMVCNRLSSAGSFGERGADDLFGYGWKGLRVALRQYDPATGFAFSTYGVTRITGEIRDGVRSEHVLPKRLTTYVRKMASAEAELAHSLGRAPKLAELAERMGEDLEKMKDLAPRLVQAASLNEMSVDGEAGAPSWLVSASPDPADAVINSEICERVSEALQKLTPDERAAVQLLLIDKVSVSSARSLTGATARQLRSRVKRGSELLRSELAAFSDLS